MLSTYIVKVKVNSSPSSSEEDCKYAFLSSVEIFSSLNSLPWSNNLPTFDTGNTKHHNTAIISSQTFSNLKNLDLNHAFVSNKVIGPDRFRFITSYWTTSQTNCGVDVGTSSF
jgi:hypothetical protein